MRSFFPAATVAALLVATAVSAPPAAVADEAAAGKFNAEAPIGILVRSGGAVYGIATAGGNACAHDLYVPNDRGNFAGCGAILRYDPDGHVAIAHAFVPREGAQPSALRAGANGTLLGVTTLGGAHGRGTSFRFDPKTNALDVLQSFGDELNPAGGPADAAAAYDDGSVLTEDETFGQFFLLENGKPATLIWHTPLTSVPGGFVLGPDGRAVFSSLAQGACFVEIDSLERSGAEHVISTPVPNVDGCAPEAALNLNLRVADDGTVVASNETQVMAGKPQSALTVIYTAPTPQPSPSITSSPRPGSTPIPPPTPPPGFFSNSADLQPNGDILLGTTHGDLCIGVGRVTSGHLTELGNFAGTPICTTVFLTVESAAGGVVGLGVVPDSHDHVVAFGIPTGGKPSIGDVFDTSPPPSTALALDQSIQPYHALAGTKIAVSWRIRGSQSVPDFSITPASLDIEMRDASREGAPFVRLRPVSAEPIRSARAVMTFDSSFSATVPLVLPTLKPGTYEFTERGGAAIHNTSDGLGIVNDGSPSYLAVTPFDLSNTDTDSELNEIQKKFVGRTADLALNLPLQCDAQVSMAGFGDRLHIKAAIRDAANPARTGFGPLGLHTYGPGDIATAYAPFYALDPIILTFTTIGNCASASAMFASIGDIERYLKPRT